MLSHTKVRSTSLQMDSAKRTFVIFSVVLLSSVIVGATDGQELSCRLLAYECYDSYEDNVIGYNMNDVDALILQINEVCTSYESYKACLLPNFNLCRSDLDDETIVNFTCSDRGRSLAEHAMSSGCIGNEEKKDEIYNNSGQCIEASSNLDHCQEVMVFKECEVQAARRHCGAAYAEFMSEIHLYNDDIVACRMHNSTNNEEEGVYMSESQEFTHVYGKK